MLHIHGQKMTVASGWDRQRAVSNHPSDPIEVLKSVGEMSMRDQAVEHRLHFAKAGRTTRGMMFEEVISTMRQKARQSSSFLTETKRQKDLGKEARYAAADANIDRMERYLSGKGSRGYETRRIEQELPYVYR